VLDLENARSEMDGHGLIRSLRLTLSQFLVYGYCRISVSSMEQLVCLQRFLFFFPANNIKGTRVREKDASENVSIAEY
jgi:hypothetical protein